MRTIGYIPPKAEPVKEAPKPAENKQKADEQPKRRRSAVKSE